MRRFTSYGPADPEEHFCVERHDLLERCVQQLLGTNIAKGGHFFTIWGARQTGKTWIMRRAVEEIQRRYGDKFAVGTLSMQGRLELNDDATVFFRSVPGMFDDGFTLEIPPLADWEDWRQLFSRRHGLFKKPLILLIDEFDSLPPLIIDRLVSLFRTMYLSRESYVLHSLALIGVRSVLGIDSPRGSPFNVQRSLQIPNLTHGEVVDMFQQYQSESLQIVEPNVVDSLFEATRGQPGLVGWFGELLTEKYNPGTDKRIDTATWESVYSTAIYVEWNNSLLNLGKKAREPYRSEVMRLFTDPNVPFSIEQDWCSYLYMNGIIDSAPAPLGQSSLGRVCRFSSTFIQTRLYANFSQTMFGHKGALPEIEIGDVLDDVFTPSGIDVPALLTRYRGYLKRLKANNIDPWIGQPRRQDLHYTEAVGHFHLYAWLRNAVDGYACSINPEFPTGNGKVDLVLRRKNQSAVIEVKSFTTMAALMSSREQPAGYALKLGISDATLVVFAPTNDDTVLEKLANDSVINGVRFITIPFGWV